MQDLLEVIRREASMVVAQRQFNGTLVATSYDPKTHMVKGMIMPHEVESGWVRIVQPHVGNGFGIAIGPKVGDAKKLDGDQFDLSFEFGDSNNLIAKHKSYSEKDAPPAVQSGEMLIKHESGNYFMFKADKSATWLHNAAQGSITWSPEGHLTVDAKGKDIHLQTSGGTVTVNGQTVNLTGAPVNINSSTS